MKTSKLLALAFGAALLSAPSFAADMATKAPVASVAGYPYAQSGIYFGVGASSAAGSATVANTGIFSAGAGVDGVVGYQWRGGLDFIALEFDATYTNLGSSATCTGATPCATNNQWELEPLVKFGFPITTITNALPNLASIFPGLPQLPSSVVPSGTQHPYVYVGVPFRDVSANYGLTAGQEWTVQPEIGAGLLSQWQSGLVADIRAGCSFGTGGFTFGPDKGATLNTICQSRLDFLY